MCGFKGYRFMGYLIYFIQGTMLTSLAVIMPILKQQLGLTYESTGMIFSMGMFGYFLGSMLTGIMLEKSGSKLPSFIGFILIPLGMTGIILSGNSISLALSNFVSNLGTAALQIALPSIAKNYTNRTGKMLNLFHSLCALGAVSSPLILGIIMNYGISWKYFYLSTALGTLIP
ncbi:MAG: MFS transporter, partial [Candidatus Moranbacteria bacterium]|nr:MFS transporter [Candidatus Moranbacteria bacterium]